jgi:hypothetical protein
MPAIRIKRGNKSNMPTTLLAGEIAVALDSRELAIGDASGNRQFVKVDSTNIIGAGSANGIATLDANGKVPTAQIPAQSGGSSYGGAFDASTGSMPSNPTHGISYRVSVAGTVNSVAYNVGDMIIYNSTTTAWDRFDGVDNVISVNGQTGAVSLATTNVSEGTNLYYTNARADARADARIASARNTANGVAGLDASSLIDPAQLPAIDGGTY